MKKSEWELLEGHMDTSAMQTSPEVLERIVRYEKHESYPIAYITFDNPERMNAIPIAGLERVGDLIREAEADDGVKVIVLRAEGEHFGTGGDARELGHYIGFSADRSKRPHQRQRLLPDRNIVWGAMVKPLRESLKPTIAQVHGYCYGGHMQMALAADIVLASPDATFTHPALRYLGPGIQDMFDWFEGLGMRKAKEILLTGRALSATEAEACGFVTKVVDRSELAAWVDDYAKVISLMPLDGLMIGKSVMRAVMEVRGKSSGEVMAWLGHGFATNQRLDPDEFNFLKERGRRGLSTALRERDEAVPPFFRIGASRDDRPAATSGSDGEATTP